jgi:structural maintenance of chromosome 4
MMKPKSQGPHDEGLLEYLEDIIGSNKHVERIEEGAKKCVCMKAPNRVRARMLPMPRS